MITESYVKSNVAQGVRLIDIKTDDFFHCTVLVPSC